MDVQRGNREGVNIYPTATDRAAAMWTDLAVKAIVVFHCAAAAAGPLASAGEAALDPDGLLLPVVKAKGLEWAKLEVSAPPRRVFRISFNANMFSWSEGNLGGLERHDYKYTPALRDSAGLPEWLKYRYSQRHKAGFLYGVPPAPFQFLEIDVVAVNRNTFEYGLLRLAVNVTDDDDPAAHVVSLKIDNLDVVDMFDAHRTRNLKALFAHNLWNESRGDLHLAYIASAVDLGFRRPLDPALKDGLVVHLGSHANFSLSLLDLDRETAVLRGFPSCPRDFKRTSVERYFRAKGFALDWCQFRLLHLNAGIYEEIGQGEEEEEEEEEGSGENGESAKDGGTSTPGSPVEYPRRDDLPLADLTFLYVQVRITQNSKVQVKKCFSIFPLQTLVPTILVFMLLFLLLSLIFCLRCPCALEEDEDLMVESSGDADKWDGLIASFFLVLKDCVTCCNSVNGREKVETVSMRNRQLFEQHRQNRQSGCGGDPRYTSTTREY